MIKASIITIGDELLIGQVIDTNSAWIAQQLNSIGIPVLRRVAVGDQWDEIWSALDEESKKADIIFITGGLGPTADDITKPLLCQYFNGKMVINKEALENVTHLFEKIFKRPITDRNIKQAEVPDTCKVIINKRGTASGMQFEKNGTIYYSLPGVPFEMMGMISEDILPLLVSTYKLPSITHKTLVTFGIGESMLADMLQSFEENLPSHIKLAYLPNHGIVRLRLTATGENKSLVENEVGNQFNSLQDVVKDFMVTNEDEAMENVIGKMLLSRNQTVATAESCTGGYIAHLISGVPGASAYYEGSMITYSYAAKEKSLQVKKSTLESQGAVSEEVVIEMAKGLLNQLNTTYAIAVSGIMGPGGGMPEKPVGTVWIAIASERKTIAQKFHFRFNRQKNIQLTAMNALNMLRCFIKEQD
jgi:nicotinamide-nucleotide amidase